MQNGGIFGYSNFGFTAANPDFIETEGIFDQAEGSAISGDSSALKTSGSRSSTKMSVLGTDIQPAAVFGYETAAAATGLFFETGAAQFLGEANGNVIGLTDSSSNAERDISSLKTDILGTETEQGSISGYTDLTYSFQFPYGVSAQNFFGQAAGNEIHLSTSASNKENDKANANMNAVGNGQISNFGSSAGASLKTATASDDDSGTSISGDLISYDASASDAKRNSASVNTVALNGFIVDPTNSATVDNTAGQSLSASQSATIVSGSVADIDALAINAARQQKNLHNEFTNPSGIIYTNTASVQNGIPDVQQTAIA